MKTNPYVLVGLFFLTISLALAQNVKKEIVTTADYDQWHSMYKTNISDDGKWAAYTFEYKNKNDTTYVKEINGNRKFSFPKNRNRQLNSTWFSCIQDTTLQLLNLNNKKLQKITSVTTYAFTKKNWVVLHKNQNKESVLMVKDNQGEDRYRFENVQQFSLNPLGTVLLLVQEINSRTTISLIYLSSGIKEAINTFASSKIFNVTWDENGKSLAFLEMSAGSPTLCMFRTSDKKMFKIKKENNWYDKISTGITQIRITKDGNEVLFWTEKEQIIEEYSNVDVWNANDDVLQIRRKKFPFPPRTLCLWRPIKGKVQVFENKDVSHVASNAKFALRRDNKPYVPSIKLDTDADYYVLDLKTGKEQLFLQEYGTPNSITMLPDSQSLLYFKASSWWLYSLKTAKRVNLTQHLPVSFVNEVFEKRNKDYPIASPLVASDGSKFLLYDSNDIWQFDTDGKNPIRLTQGKEKGQVVRVAEVNLSINKNAFWMINTGAFYTAHNPLLLTVRNVDYGAYGFGWFQPNKSFEIKYMESKRLEVIAKLDNSIVFKTQSFDSPPELLYWDIGKNKTKCIVKSNPQHKKFEWGFNNSIHYKNEKGEQLQGILFYPANYDEKKRYPMVVSIYQKRGYERHDYKNPSLYNSIGFNTSNLTTKGYFVLFPDITYQLGNPGFSALDCVMAAVKSAVQLKAIDATNVALIGHSYGGFETNFIITQTNFFKTAIASAGVTDFTSRYFSMSENHVAPETWRFEFEQGRMKGSLFDHKTQYQRNSPIEHVENVNTPLLTWTGEKDTQVNPYQSMEFYIALRRLGKQHIMIVYPDEGHVITNPEKQKDLTLKMEEWLGFYLKNDARPKWMIPNFQYQTH